MSAVHPYSPVVASFDKIPDFTQDRGRITVVLPAPRDICGSVRLKPGLFRAAPELMIGVIGKSEGAVFGKNSNRICKLVKNGLHEVHFRPKSTRQGNFSGNILKQKCHCAVRVRSTADRVNRAGWERPCLVIVSVFCRFEKIIHLSPPTAIVFGFWHHMLIPQGGQKSCSGWDGSSGNRAAEWSGRSKRD